MTQGEMLRKLRNAHWRGIERLVRRAYEVGLERGRKRAHGHRRQGRTIRDDATVAGLVQLIERHFGLDRYAFEIRVVHRGSGRRVPLGALLRAFHVKEE